MSNHHPLRGSCNCGRNEYIIVIPHSEARGAEVFFDDSAATRRSQASLMSAWLRVPLTWYSSVTRSLLPDETHSEIRRTYTPHDDPYAKRNFCGFCGTHLTYWTEQPSSESDYMSVTLGSLRRDDILALEDMELLPEDVQEHLAAHTANDSAVGIQQHQSDNAMTTSRQGKTGDLSWFEEMIDGSRLGRTQRTRKGMGVSADGTTQVQWEIAEYHDDVGPPEQQTMGAKRKIGDVMQGDPDAMQS